MTSRISAILLASVIPIFAFPPWLKCAENVEPATLDSVVVAGYQGKKLVSVCAEGERKGKTAERIDIDEYRLRISGGVASPQALTYEEVLGFPHVQKAITVQSVEGWAETVVFDGVLVSDVIGIAGTAPGTHEVIFRSQDGYQTLLPLDSLVAKNILLGFAADSVSLTPEGGYPFLLVAESVRGQDWLKWVTAIELTNRSIVK